MPFEQIIKTIVESNLDNFNDAKYLELKSLCTDNIELISQAVDLPKVKIPAYHAKNFDEVLLYWQDINQRADNQITKLEYLELGKKSVIRCYYEKIDLVMDTELYFDTYAKIYKIVNLVVFE